MLNNQKTNFSDHKCFLKKTRAYVDGFLVLETAKDLDLYYQFL